MTDSFAPEAVARFVELLRTTDADRRTLRRKIHHEYPTLTALGLDRVLDRARQRTCCGETGTQGPAHVTARIALKSLQPRNCAAVTR